jgi:hypothetical protein
MPRFLIAALAVLTVTTTSFAQGIIAPTAGPINITPASKFRMLLHTNPTRERGECLGTRAGASEDM